MINVHYFNKTSNFGDILNPYLLKKLFNIDIKCTDIKNCDCICIGSVLGKALCSIEDEYINKSLYVWGSGFILPYHTKKKKLIRPLIINAIRGKLTKECLEYYMPLKSNNLAYGDPGLLTSLAFKNIDMTKKYEYGIIPHYADLNSENLKKIKLNNYCIINPTLSVEEVVNKLVKCKKILSSAMHGLIVADSFNIPNIRLILSDNIIGGDFKYNDYYSVFGISDHNKLDLRKNIEITEKDLNFEYKITKQQVETIQKQLIERFPYAKN